MGINIYEFLRNPSAIEVINKGGTKKEKINIIGKLF